MNASARIIRLPTVGLLLAIFLAGCAGSPPVNLYTLSAVGLPSTDTRVPQSTPAVVAVGPVTLPDYIDRPQIVTRHSGYQMEKAAGIIRHPLNGPFGSYMSAGWESSGVLRRWALR